MNIPNTLYFAATFKNHDKLYSTVIELGKSTDLYKSLRDYPHLDGVTLMPSKKEAYETVEIWNHNYQQNGDYGFQMPDGKWCIYDKETDKLITGGDELVAIPKTQDVPIIEGQHYDAERQVGWFISDNYELHITGQSIAYSPNLPEWARYEYDKAIITCDQIMDRAFIGFHCKELSVSCDLIGKSAFSNCTAERISLNVGTISQDAFSHCPNLTEATLNNIDSIFPYAFVDCKELKVVDICENTLDKIEKGTFATCPKLEILSIQDNPKLYIEDGAVPKPHLDHGKMVGVMRVDDLANGNGLADDVHFIGEPDNTTDKKQNVSL